jgi:phosphoglycolate phosphatase-like HAD superfamily hydrolase
VEPDGRVAHPRGPGTEPAEPAAGRDEPPAGQQVTGAPAGQQVTGATTIGQQVRAPMAGRQDGGYAAGRQPGGAAAGRRPEAVAGDETGTEVLRGLISAAHVVLFDFDGPLCRLFAPGRAEQVAAGLIAWVEEQGLHDTLLAQERRISDPRRVLDAVEARHPGSDLAADLEERLTQEELRAAACAWPVPYTDPLLWTWLAAGTRLAVTTNNSPRAVRAYLADRGLTSCIAPHVYGRDPAALHLLKPHPHTLNRALSAMGTPPTAALMIGDSPADLAAAQAAGVPFLGYAPHERKAARLREAGAQWLVSSMKTVLDVVRSQAL